MDQPPCPNESDYPLNQFHYERTRLLDALYNAAEKDENGEFVSSEVNDAYNATVYGTSNGIVVNQAWFVRRCPFRDVALPVNETICHPAFPGCPLRVICVQILR